jgi:ribokinase
MDSVAHPSLFVFGSINVDLIATPDRLPRPGETVLAPDYRIAGGGKGANQAIAAARARTTPNSGVVMVGVVGKDDFGDGAVAELQDESVEVEFVNRGVLSTGCAFISVDPAGENMIIVASGANLEAHAGLLPEFDIGPGSVVLMQNEVPMAETLLAAKIARSAGATTVLNFAPATIPATGHVVYLLENIDVLVVNEHEHAVLAHAAGIDVAKGAEAMARAIAGRFGVNVIVTLGEEGALLVTRDGEVTVERGAPITSIDTTGAGDTLTGVLAVSLVEGHQLKSALARANRAAALSCLGRGARGGMPQAAEIDASIEPGQAA